MSGLGAVNHRTETTVPAISCTLAGSMRRLGIHNFQPLQELLESLGATDVQCEGMHQGGLCFVAQLPHIQTPEDLPTLDDIAKIIRSIRSLLHTVEPKEYSGENRRCRTVKITTPQSSSVHHVTSGHFYDEGREQDQSRHCTYHWNLSVSVPGFIGNTHTQLVLNLPPNTYLLSADMVWSFALKPRAVRQIAKNPEIVIQPKDGGRSIFLPNELANYVFTINKEVAQDSF